MTLNAELEPSTAEDEAGRRYQLLTLSARTPEALRDLASRYESWLQSHPDASLADICYTAALGRSHLEQRAALVVDSKERARELLHALAADQPAPGLLTGACTDPPKTAWLFTGQGSQYAGMARQLYDTYPLFRDVLDHCDEVLHDLLPRPLLEVMFNDLEAVNHTSYAQPALFALQMALARLWQSWGLEPDVVLGHSVGQYAAACVARVFTLDDGLRLLAERGRLMGAIPPGGRMVAVFADAASVEEALDPYPHLSVAAYNGAHTVVSGPATDIDALVTTLTGQNVRCQFLETSHAFHSELIEPVLDDFEAYARQFEFGPLQRALVDNRTGKLLSAQTILDASYWRRHARQPVQFAESVSMLSELGCKVLLELGPQPVLTAMAMRAWPPAPELPRPVTSLRREVPDARQLTEALGLLYVAGARPDFAATFPASPPHKLDLPTYPFQRRRYWPKSAGMDGDGPRGHGMLGSRRDLASGDVAYTSRFSIKHQAWLRDHVIYGNVVVPGATYAAMALMAADLPAELQEVFFFEPIIFSDTESREVQLTLHTPDDADPGTRTFQVHSRPYEDRDSPWSLNATGTLIAEPEVQAAPQEPPDRIAGRLMQARPQLLLDWFADKELKWGAIWRTSFAAVWAGEGEALGELRVGEELAEHLGDEPIHPVLLDLCTGVAGASLMAAAQGTNEDIGLYLPLKYERLSLSERMPRRFFCHVRWQDRNMADSETQAFDLDFISSDGRSLGGIKSFTVKRAPRQALLRGLAANSGRLLYRLTWRELAVGGPSDETALKPGLWLVVGDSESAVVEAIRHQLATLRQRVIVASPGGEWDEVEDDHVVFSPTRPEHWLKLARMANEQGTLSGIVWQVAPEPSGDESPDRMLERMRGDVEGLLEALNNVLRTPLPRGLWILTERALASEPGEHVDPVQAGFWGLGRTIAAEQPETRCTLLDHDGSADALRLLGDVLLSIDAEPQMALRSRRCLVPRMMAWARAGQVPVPASEHYRLDPGPRGAVEQLQLIPADVPAPEPLYVQVRVEAAGLNFRDVLNTLGLYPGDPGPVGGELAGVVTAVGESVEDFAVGDRVFGFGPGAFADLVNAPYQFLAPLPPNLSAVEATTTPTTMLTAGLAFDWAQPKPGERVLIHAASGGVGMAAIQLARNAGAVIYATASRPKQKLLREMGIDHVYDSRSTSYGSEILADTNGEGVDVVLNSLTGEGFIEATVRACAQNARFIEIAKINTWSPEQMAEARPDIRYMVLALDDIMKSDPARIYVQMKDLAARLQRDELRPLPYQAFPITEAKAAFRFMQQARHIGKIVLQLPAPLAARQDRSYLITGGLGALGLRTAAYLAQLGAGDIVLTSRREPDAQTQRAIDETAAQFNTRIHVHTADVGDEAQLTELLEWMRRELAPIGGIAHLAGVLDDALLTAQTWQCFETVMAPKALAALHLDRLTRADPLDFFLLYSSAAALLGAPGQANYAMANAVLDGLAAKRQSQGLPATSFDWGPWAEAGMAATEKARLNLAKQGLIPLKPAAALAAMSEAVSQGSVQAAVIDANWERSAKLFGSMRPPILEHVLPRAITGALGDNLLLKQLQQVPPAQRGDFVTEHLQRELQQILGFAQPPSPDSRFLELGMDSLMAVELRNRLLGQFGSEFTISSTVVFDYPTVRTLANYIAGQSAAALESAPAVATQPAADTPTVEVLRSSVSEAIERLKPLRDLGIELQLDGRTVEVGQDREVLEGAFLRREAEKACREVMAEATLPADLRPQQPRASGSRRRHSVLTGATGFAGGFLLRDLLMAGSTVTCIVRSQNQAEGAARVRSNLRAMGIWDAALDDGLRVVPGDIENQRLGLSEEAYSALASETDSVFHCAGGGRPWTPYADVRGPNVAGTQNMIQLACDGAPKVLHLLSTTDVLAGAPYEDGALFDEEAFPDTPLGIVSSLGQSKWAAESLARQSMVRGALVTIYRAGAILGPQDGSFWPRRHLTTELLSFEMTNGIVNAAARGLDGLPVDIVTRFIEAASAGPGPAGQTFHLVHPRPPSSHTWVQALARHGVAARPVTGDEWLQALKTGSDVDAHLFELRGLGMRQTLAECLGRPAPVGSTAFQGQMSVLGMAVPDYEELIEQGWIDALVPTQGNQIARPLGSASLG